MIRTSPIRLRRLRRIRARQHWAGGRDLRKVHGEIGSEIAIEVAQNHLGCGAEAHRARPRGPSGLSLTSAMEWSGTENRDGSVNRVRQPAREF
ncbi:hypothetical protein GCM10009700_18070 [Brevibacterium sanguinis]